MGTIRPGSLVRVNEKKREPQSSAGKYRAAMISPKWQQMKLQILEAYRDIGRGWAGFQPPERASISAIARTLFRKGRVNAFGSDQIIALALKQLAAEGKISLPPKKFKRPPKKPKQQGT